MKSACPAIFLGLIVAASAAVAAPCVKVRDGEKWACMQFSAAETRNAAKYGLQLGSAFEGAKKALLQQGWVLDREWLAQNAPQPVGKEEKFCGNGLDALCSTAFRRNGVILVLTFSGTDEGTPLIDVREDE